MGLSQHIEWYNLAPDLTGNEVDDMVAQGISLGLQGIVVPPFWVKRASREIAGRDLLLGSVAGYPLGFQMTEAKMLEAELAIRDGADFVDFTFHTSSFAVGMPWTKIELAKASHLLHGRSKLFQVLFNVRAIRREQWANAIKLAADTGCDAVTFLFDVAPDVSKVVELRQLISRNIMFKIQTPIRSKDEAKALLANGADVLSTDKVDWIIA